MQPTYKHILGHIISKVELSTVTSSSDFIPYKEKGEKTETLSTTCCS